MSRTKQSFLLGEHRIKVGSSEENFRFQVGSRLTMKAD